MHASSPSPLLLALPPHCRPPPQVQALLAAAAPATQTLVRKRARRQQASTARLREVLQERTRQYERSAEAAARRDGADMTGTTTHLHLLLACYERLTLPQEKKFSRRVLVSAPRGAQAE